VIVENNFGFRMKAEEMADVKSLQDFYSYIIKRVNPN
jgi:acyl carrier protein